MRYSHVAVSTKIGGIRRCTRVAPRNGIPEWCFIFPLFRCGIIILSALFTKWVHKEGVSDEFIFMAQVVTGIMDFKDMLTRMSTPLYRYD